jgi:hypothetical protein
MHDLSKVSKELKTTLFEMEFFASLHECCINKKYIVQLSLSL